MGTAVVFAGGPAATGPPGSGAPTVLEGLRADLVVAADSGLDVAAALGWRVDLIVGDLDSVTRAALDEATRGGAEVRRHPVDKDATDLELALDVVATSGCEHVVVVGSASGRMDHLLGGALVLAAPRFAHLRIDGWLGHARVVPVHQHRDVVGVAGQIVSILPVGGHPVVTTTGLRWPLSGELLDPGTSRGISNELLDGRAEVAVEGGTVVVVLPADELPADDEEDR